MIDLFVQLNWHVVWQAAVVMLIASAFCLMLRDRPSGDHSSHRFWIWLCACVSPMVIVPITAGAAGLHWQFYTKLLVWRWMFPTGLPAAVSPIPSSGIHWVTWAYLVWLVAYVLLTVAQVVALRSWLALHHATLYAWQPQERAIFDALCESFQVRRPPMVYQVETDVAPFTFCWWRPAIVLPSDFYRASDDLADVRAILAHEIAHIKHGHLEVSSFLRLVVWLFPLSQLSLWRANRSLRNEMELVADSAAVQTGGADEWALKRALKHYIRRDHLRLSTIGFAALAVQRLDRSLRMPLARSLAHLWFVPTLCAVVSQVSAVLPPLSVAGPLLAASLAPTIVPSLRPYTETVPTYPRYEAFVYVPPPIYINPELFRPMPVPHMSLPDYSQLRQMYTPRVEIESLRYTPPLSFQPVTPLMTYTPPPVVLSAPPMLDTTPYAIPPLLDGTRRPPAFNPGIATDALPTIEAPAIPKSGR